MNIELTDAEHKILTWLNDNSNGYGEEFSHSGQEVLKGTGLADAEATKAVSFLQGMGLIGVSEKAGPSTPPATHTTIKVIWLTVQGENVRRQEQQRRV